MKKHAATVTLTKDKEASLLDQAIEATPKAKAKSVSPVGATLDDLKHINRRKHMKVVELPAGTRLVHVNPRAISMNNWYWEQGRRYRNSTNYPSITIFDNGEEILCHGAILSGPVGLAEVDHERFKGCDSKVGLVVHGPITMLIDEAKLEEVSPGC